MVAKMSLPKRSAPYWSNPPLIFWYSSPFSLSPERQSAQMSNNKKGLDQCGPDHFKCYHSTPLALKGLKGLLWNCRTVYYCYGKTHWTLGLILVKMASGSCFGFLSQHIAYALFAAWSVLQYADAVGVAWGAYSMPNEKYGCWVFPQRFIITVGWHQQRHAAGKDTVNISLVKAR